MASRADPHTRWREAEGHEGRGRQVIDCSMGGSPTGGGKRTSMHFILCVSYGPCTSASTHRETSGSSKTGSQYNAHLTRHSTAQHRAIQVQHSTGRYKYSATWLPALHHALTHLGVQEPLPQEQVCAEAALRLQQQQVIQASNVHPLNPTTRGARELEVGRVRGGGRGGRVGAAAHPTARPGRRAAAGASVQGSRGLRQASAHTSGRARARTGRRGSGGQTCSGGSHVARPGPGGQPRQPCRRVPATRRAPRGALAVHCGSQVQCHSEGLECHDVSQDGVGPPGGQPREDLAQDGPDAPQVQGLFHGEHGSWGQLGAGG